MAATIKTDQAADQLGWQSLGTPASELRLEWTLPTGQSFRWRQTGKAPLEFTGVIGQRAVRLRQLPDDVEYQVIARGDAAAAAQDAAALHEYFNLSHSLAELAPGWCAACARYAHVHPHLPGARMLRQDPVECLFQFICSSNNHISRIHGMVERLCRQYGTPLLPAAAGGAPAVGGMAGAAGGMPAGLELIAFPTLEQLSAATEEGLRADGFGYRAKFITGSVAQLLAKPEGGSAWLLGLRSLPYEEAAEALVTLPGIGPKVAACICLFSLDKHEAIPVDTHVWTLACKYYTPHLRGKSLTKKVHLEVQAAFVQRFGAYAGWAHNSLFIGQLASTRDKVPALATGGGGGGSKRKAGGNEESSGNEDSEEGGGGSGSEYSPAEPPKGGLLPDTPPGADAPQAAGVAKGRPARQPRKRAAKK